MVYSGKVKKRAAHVRSWQPEEALKAATEVRGFLPFFSFLSMQIRHGGSSRSLSILSRLIPGRAAWQIIESWDTILACESQTGWSPELAAAVVVMTTCEEWKAVDWYSLANEMAKKPTAS